MFKNKIRWKCLDKDGNPKFIFPNKVVELLLKEKAIGYHLEGTRILIEKPVLFDTNFFFRANYTLYFYRGDYIVCVGTT